MNQQPICLPQPSDFAADISMRLSHVLRQRALNQPLSFADYMQAALYEPGLGYYVAGSHKLGEGGDFTTAPLVSSLYSQCVARQCLQVLQALGTGIILEFGAGTGQMALDILRYCQSQQQLPERYIIVEVSADLIERQQQLFADKAPDLMPCVSWSATLPESFDGVVLANEVLDAMPVEVFRQGAELEQAMVAYDDAQGWHYQWQIAHQHCQKAVSALQLALPHGYLSEINLHMQPWCQMLYQHINRGVVLMMDYGFPRREYYHPDRHQGTLMCHYQHLAHSDPFVYPGLCDITAHVDFTALAEAGDAVKFDIAGYTNQANALMNLGILDLAQANTKVQQQLQQSQALQKLLMPHEMGELFKWMLFAKHLDLDFIAFTANDQLARL